MFNHGNPSRPASVMARGQEHSRSVHPQLLDVHPARSLRCKVIHGSSNHTDLRRPIRTVASRVNRPRPQSMSPTKSQQNPAIKFQRTQFQRRFTRVPGSTRGFAKSSLQIGPLVETEGQAVQWRLSYGNSTALQLAPAPSKNSYDNHSRSGRPQSQYYPEEGSYGASQLGSRNRSQSVGAQRQVTKTGAQILHYCK